MSGGGTWLEASRSPEYSPALISRTLEKISASLGSMEYFDESAFYGETIIVGGFLNTNLIMANSITANHLAADAITADKVQIGGTSDGVLRVKDANDRDIVLLNKDGIVLNNGARLISQGGVLSVLQYVSVGTGFVDATTNGFGRVGLTGFISEGYDKVAQGINVYVPKTLQLLRLTYK